MWLRLIWGLYCISICYGSKTKSELIEYAKGKFLTYNSDTGKTMFKFALSESTPKKTEMVQALTDELLERGDPKLNKEVQLFRCLCATVLTFPEWKPSMPATNSLNSSNLKEESLLGAFLEHYKPDIQKKLQLGADNNPSPNRKFKVISVGVSVQFVHNGEYEEDSIGVCFILWRPDDLMYQLYQKGISLGTTALLLAFEYGLRKDKGMLLKGKEYVLTNLDLDDRNYELGLATLRLRGKKYEFRNHKEKWLPVRMLDLNCMAQRQPAGLNCPVLFGYGIYAETLNSKYKHVSLELIAYATLVETPTLPREALPKYISPAQSNSELSSQSISACPISQVVPVAKMIPPSSDVEEDGKI